MGSASIQGRLWSQNARQWAERQEKMHLPLYEGVLDALSPKAGTKLLDSGCGSGMFLSLAGRTGAKLHGLDAAPGLLDVARQRAPEADLKVGDLEELPYDARTFDYVTAFNAVQYAADPKRALSELARVAKPRGYVAIGQWADAARCQTEALFASLKRLVPPPPGAAAPLALSGAGQLEARMSESGLLPIAWGEAASPFVYASLEDAWLAMASSGPLVRIVEAVGQERTRQAVLDAFRDGLQTDGTVRHENFFRWVVAQPAA